MDSLGKAEKTTKGKAFRVLLNANPDFNGIKGSFEKRTVIGG